METRFLFKSKNFYSLKMSKSFQKISKQRANNGKTCIKKPERNVTRLESVKQNMFKSLVNPENQNIPDFVLLNKKIFFDKIDRKLVNGIQVLGKKGFTCFLFFILHYTNELFCI